MCRFLFRILFFSFFLVPFWSDGNRELLLAISAKNFDAVQKAIEIKKASVSYRDVNKRTPLHWAVISGDLKIVAYLVYKGASLEAKEKNGATPLHFVAYSKNLDILKYLIQQGANIHTTDSAGWTPLHYYTYYQFEMGVKYLIYIETDLEARTTKPAMGIPEGSTALDIAIKLNKHTYIEALSNPQTYQNLASRPRLFVQNSLQLSFSNILLSQESGLLSISVLNDGQGNADATILEFRDISNDVYILRTNIFPQAIRPNSAVQWQLTVNALTPPKDTLCKFSVRAVDLSTKRASSWEEVNFWIWSPRPPSLSLTATLFSSTNALRPSTQTSLYLSLSNDGLGPLHEPTLYVRDSKKWIISTNMKLATLPRSSFTNLSINLMTTETVEDGETSLEILVASPSLSKQLVFTRSVPTKGYLPPFLVIVPSLYQKMALVITTNQMMLETGGFIETISTNTVLFTYPMFDILNIGEKNATNLTVQANVSGGTNMFLYTYRIAILGPNEKRSLAIPILKSEIEQNTFSLLITDGVTNYVETNFSFTLWPRE